MKNRLCKLPLWIKMIVVVVLSFGIAYFVEMMFFDAKRADETIELQAFPLAEQNAYSKTTQEDILEPLTQNEQNSVEINRENAKILAELNGTIYEEEKDDTLVEKDGKMYRKKINTIFTVTLPQASYVRKIHLQYRDMEEAGSYQLQGILDGAKVFEGDDGIISEKIDVSVVTLNKCIDEIIYSYKSTEAPVIENMQLTVVNIAATNWLRVLFMAISIILGAILLMAKMIFDKKPELVFAIFSLTLGSLLILCVGTNQIGFDEYAHATRAYEISFGSTIQTTESAMRMKANDLPIFHNTEERHLVEEYEEINNDFSWANITTQSRFITYSDRSYLPIAFFIKIGRALHMPFAWNMMFGKLGNLLAYTLLSYLAIKYAKSGKGIIAMLALMPNALFAAAGFTYDSIVNGFLLLAVVLTTNLMLEEEKKITWIQVLLVLGAYVAGSTAKPIYIVMALMLVFFSQKRFENKVQTWGFRAAIVALVGIMMYTIFFPPVSTSANYELVGNIAYAGDKRNQGTSVIGQLQYILGNPLAFTKLLLSSMFGNLLAYTTGMQKLFNYGYLGELSGVTTVIAEVILVSACLFAPKEERPVIAVKYKVLNIIMIFGMSALIWTSMYVSYTPVGSTTIEGVQARYFMPLFLPFCYCLFHKRWNCRLTTVVYRKILIGTFGFYNLYAIYTLALKQLNF